MADGLMIGDRIDRIKKNRAVEDEDGHHYLTGTVGWFNASIAVDSMLKSKIHNFDIQFKAVPNGVK